MQNNFSQIWTSKKFLASMAWIICAILAHKWIAIPEDALWEILTMLWAYIIGQWVSDIGKHAKK